MRYAPEKVVALLDTERAGETEHGFPVVGSVDDALPLQPDDGARRRRDRGRPLPAGVPRADPLVHRERARRRERAARVPDGRHGARRARAQSTSVELRDLRKPPPDLNVPTGENLEVPAKIVLTVGSDCAIGKMTVALELDREAKRRGVASRVRADGTDGHRDRGLGDLGRRGRRGLHRGRRGAARRRGPSRAAASC